MRLGRECLVLIEGHHGDAVTLLNPRRHAMRADLPFVAALERFDQADVRPMAILDRDGVINRDGGFVCTPERFQWVDGTVEAIRLLHKSGFRVVIATNQSGIARGLFSEHDFKAFMAWVAEQLADSGTYFDACFYCPHHPTAGIGEYRVACECRKPSPGMLLAAFRMFPTEIGRSFLIGDRESDLRAARSAGVIGLRFEGDQPIGDLVASAIAKADH